MNPETYLDEIRAEVPRYDELQEETIEAIPFAPRRCWSSAWGPARRPAVFGPTPMPS
jgi:hypothetical protein